MTLSVALIGATGYTGLEVARILSTHPNAQLKVATARADAGKPISHVHPSLAGRLEIELEALDPARIAKRCDVAMCCLPHAASAETVRQLVDVGVRVIDFSADFRLSSLDVYESWYDVKHPWPERVGKTVYGLPEFFADEIAGADVVANPGCYPTSAILPLAPLIREGLVQPDDIIIDSKSGVSGAGRSAKVATLREATHVITRYRGKETNLRTQLHRVIESAGLVPWPKTYVNLRGSCRTMVGF